jgi:hypothetical protein
MCIGRVRFPVKETTRNWTRPGLVAADESAEAAGGPAIGATGVVGREPGVRHGLRLPQGHEDGGVEHLLAVGAVEAVDGRPFCSGLPGWMESRVRSRPVHRAAKRSAVQSGGQRAVVRRMRSGILTLGCPDGAIRRDGAKCAELVARQEAVRARSECSRDRRYPAA